MDLALKQNITSKACFLSKKYLLSLLILLILFIT